jgi:2-polyprenyl-3-methyl-5-hydroxy-6-metoxy-1,4-benzoquinol methylase
MLITEAYRKELQKIHRKDADWGSGPRGNIIKICHFIYYNDVKRILDYGCGKGELLGWFLPIQVANYDPAITQWAADPTPQDYLLCTDVLEHVEPECIKDVIEHLVSKFNKKAFLGISLVESRKLLSDGRNSHLLIKPIEWWIGLLQKFCTIEQIEFVNGIIYVTDPKGNKKFLRKDVLITLNK